MNIGITLRQIDDYYYVKKRYLSYVKRLKYNIIFLSISNIKDIYKCDLFLITGGNDVHPYLYNESITSNINISKGEDYLDLLIIDYAYKNKKPLLGICRGMQIINVYFNGSLYQDIDNHQNTQHKVKSKYKEFLSNSYHHQSIKKLGNNLIAFLESNDGEIEGIYHNTLPIVGVQFHPEINPSSFDYIYLLTLCFFKTSK